MARSSSETAWKSDQTLALAQWLVRREPSTDDQPNLAAWKSGFGRQAAEAALVDLPELRQSSPEHAWESVYRQIEHMLKTYTKAREICTQRAWGLSQSDHSNLRTSESGLVKTRVLRLCPYFYILHELISPDLKQNYGLPPALLQTLPGAGKLPASSFAPLAAPIDASAPAVSFRTSTASTSQRQEVSYTPPGTPPRVYAELDGDDIMLSNDDDDDDDDGDDDALLGHTLSNPSLRLSESLTSVSPALASLSRRSPATERAQNSRKRLRSSPDAAIHSPATSRHQSQARSAPPRDAGSEVRTIDHVIVDDSMVSRTLPDALVEISRMYFEQEAAEREAQERREERAAEAERRRDQLEQLRLEIRLEGKGARNSLQPHIRILSGLHWLCEFVNRQYLPEKQHLVLASLRAHQQQYETY
ncbi:uncharacterized protein L969DRAFT_44707 [Mixia osmundae IAM 14324]|uniref:Uncharacterized protein n=1 Tax=Mixia osmundae (strain CBS 9802 / IAM 14324 / JCM 22182 / KY 12970) TaxID=764103 RepID=G7DYN5_MIXOS|nr:uncharacterized protein L969DRAFT_44707 [Mixia osmundae IAM 14324]KEI41594.1 hypothetical protein L969DRAFT_44707 [Mixia osmundae IAM 14324]GAA95695.1 hypothetical protein E5Q_02352 [Mixia osmundae IAM 14324]